MIITCPHCQTKYQVAYEAIGSVGRKVQCAQCRQAWKQRAPTEQDPPTEEQRQAQEAMTEDALDEILVAEARDADLTRRQAAEERRAEIDVKDEPITEEALPQPTKIDPATQQKRQRAFSQRQNAMEAHLPLAKLRRSVRVLTGVVVIAVFAGAYFGRVQVVERFPEMAGVYEAVGLGVNVVGLEFSNVTTLQTTRDGKRVLSVSAQIVGKKATPVAVPAVVVTLVDGQGRDIYEWSVAPSVRDLMAGERSTFDTQITAPPGEAVSVRLSFAGGYTSPSAKQAASTTPVDAQPRIPEH